MMLVSRFLRETRYLLSTHYLLSEGDVPTLDASKQTIPSTNCEGNFDTPKCYRNSKVRVRLKSTSSTMLLFINLNNNILIRWKHLEKDKSTYKGGNMTRKMLTKFNKDDAHVTQEPKTML